MTKATFTTTVHQEEGMNATGLQVPAESVAAMGKGKRPPVWVNIGGHRYRSTVAAYGDVFMLPLSQENRAAAGVKPGDLVEVTIELDTELRTVEVPDDLAAALAVQDLTAVFDALAPSRRKEFVRQVESAKAEETRTRRIIKIVSELANT
jgi:hypothetical protein